LLSQINRVGKKTKQFFNSGRIRFHFINAFQAQVFFYIEKIYFPCPVDIDCHFIAVRNICNYVAEWTLFCCL
jgi:hypothetical protein